MKTDGILNVISNINDEIKQINEIKKQLRKLDIQYSVQEELNKEIIKRAMEVQRWIKKYEQQNTEQR